MLFSSEVDLLKCFSVCIYMLSLELNYQMGLREGFGILLNGLTRNIFLPVPRQYLVFVGFFCVVILVRGSSSFS